MSCPEIAGLSGFTVDKTDAGNTVRDYLYDIQQDTTKWSNDASSSLNLLESTLSDLPSEIELPEPFDFSVTLAGSIGDFTAPLPETSAIGPWNLSGSPPTYNGPTQPQVGINPIAPPNVGALSVTAPQPYIKPSESLYTPVVPTLQDFSNLINFTDPGNRPVGSTITPVIPYTPPSALSLDLSNIGLPLSPEPTPPPTPNFQDILQPFPTVPVVTPIDLTGLPSTIPSYDPGVVSWDFSEPVPEWNKDAPDLDYSGQPGPFDPTITPVKPTLTPVVPAVYDPPDKPEDLELDELVIPDVPDITIPDFEPINTNFGELTPLSVGLDYSDEGFSGGHLDELIVDIKQVLAGSVGLPAPIWEAIWDKASVQIVRTGVARERQGRNAWAKLGWSMPGGVALAQQEQAAFDINQQLSEKAREQAIQAAVMGREDFWKAMEQGIAAEKLLREHYHMFQERQLKAAIALVETITTAYNANVARYSASVAATQALIAVRDQEIRTLLVPLEVSKVKLDGVKTQAEVQGQLLQNQALKWENIKTAIQQYLAEIEGKKNELAFQAQQLEIFGLEVKLRESEVNEWAKQWDGYTSKIEAQKAIASAYTAEVGAFSERVRGYASMVEAERAKVTAESETEQLKLAQARYNLEEFNTKLDKVLKTNTLSIQHDEVRARLFQTDVQKSSAKTEAKASVENLRLEVFKSDIAGYQSQLESVARRASAIATYYGAEATRYQADAAGARAEVDASATQTQAEASVVGAEAQAYRAAVDGESSATQAEASLLEAQMRDRQIAWDNQKTLADASATAYDAAHRGAVAAVEANRHTISANSINEQLKASEWQAKSAAFSAGAQQMVAETNANAKQVDAARAATDAEVAAYDAQVRGESARIQGQAQVEATKASWASAQSSWAESKVRSQATQFQAEAEQAKLNQVALVETARLQTQKLLQISEMQVKGLESIGQIYAQLVAGAYSAASVSASIGDSYSGRVSASVGCSESYSTNYEGAAEEAAS